MIATVSRVAMAAFVLAAAGCTTPPNIEIFNNTGDSLVVDVAVLHSWPRLPRAVIPDGQSEEYTLSVGVAPRRLRLMSGGCAYEYRVPRVWSWLQSPEAKSYYGYIAKVQVEADLSISLLPRAPRGIAQPEQLLRRDGFPIRPISKTCGGAPGGQALLNTSAPSPAAASARL